MNIDFDMLFMNPLTWVLIIAALALSVGLPLWNRSRKKRRLNMDDFGFAYDKEQDIFYSTMDAWQRQFGYCRLYDEAAAPLSMIIDCDPITFDYDGKKWLIEFWKGQYGGTTGCEVGVYTASGPDLNIPGTFNGTLYDKTDDLLPISISLKKGGKTLFSRKGSHWWMTGFVLGKFSQPHELTVSIAIRMQSKQMQRAFVQALQRAGYTHREYATHDLDVRIRYLTPHTQQPFTRTAKLTSIAQKNNKRLCGLINKATAGIAGGQEKLAYIQQHNPILYGRIASSSRPTRLYSRTFKRLGKAKAARGDDRGEE